jgi:hypothetical protein
VAEISLKINRQNNRFREYSEAVFYWKSSMISFRSKPLKLPELIKAKTVFAVSKADK